jgi:hypothetical protein
MDEILMPRWTWSPHIPGDPAQYREIAKKKRSLPLHPITHFVIFIFSPPFYNQLRNKGRIHPRGATPEGAILSLRHFMRTGWRFSKD